MEFWVFILTLWAFARWLQTRIWRRKDDQRFERVIEALNRGQAKIESLEKRVRELEHPAAAPAATAAPSTSPVHGQAPKPVEPPISSPIPSWPTEPKAVSPPHENSKAPASAPPPEPVKLPEPVHLPAPVPTPLPVTVPTPPTPTHPTTPSSHPPPRAIPPLLSPPPKFADSSVRQISADFEQKLGGNWLNKIGITMLVIGVTLFLTIKFPTLSNPAKIAICYFGSLAVLGAGIYLERLERYRIFARSLIGGGWALVFLTTYAMHFVPYTRVIETQWVDLILLFFVAAAMVFHTLRYDSQVVTGLAFLLAYTSVTISQNTIYSLSAGVILALGLVTIVHRRSWFELEVFGILASYLNHFVWLTRVVPTSGHHHMFSEFLPSSVLLVLYWAAYRWSYVSRRIERASQETISTLAAILNTSLLLLLFRYQSVHPEWSFYALIVLGTAELVIAQLAARDRRIAFVILSSIGVVLLIAAIPFKYSGLDMAIIWLAEAQILLIAGVAVREQLFRSFGFLVALLTAGEMLISQGIPNLLDVLPPELATLTPSSSLPDYQLAFSFLVAAAVFYANAIVIPRRWKELVESEFEEIFYHALTYLGAAMLFIGLALAFSRSWMALAWAGAAFALLLVGRSLDASDLIAQTHLLALAAFLRAILVNSFDTHPFGHTEATMRLLTLPLIIALLYLCARWLALSEDGAAVKVSELYTTAAAFLVVLLAYHESHWAWVGIAWGGFALALAIFGFYRDRRDLGWQAHFIVLAGFARTLLFDSDATQQYSHFTLRLLTFTSMAALLYLCAYFSGPRHSPYARMFSALHTFAGSILLALLAFFEVASPWIAVSWALFAFLLIVIGDRVRRAELHLQAYILSGLSLFQLFTVNLYAAQPFHFFPAVSVRVVTFALVAVSFYLCGRWAARADFISKAAFIGFAYSWLGSFLVLVLLKYELRPPAIALGWALFGLVLFEFGLFRRSHNWRLQGYAAFTLAFLLVWNLDTRTSLHDLLFYTLPIAFVLYYAYARLARLAAYSSTHHLSFDVQYQGPAILSYFGSATLAIFALDYFAWGPSLVAWAALAFLFIAIAWFTRQDVFLHHSIILAFLLFFRVLAFEFSARFHPAEPWATHRVLDAALACAILFACQAFAFPLRARRNGQLDDGGDAPDMVQKVSRFLSRPEQVYFFIPLVLATFLILQEVSTGRVTIAWGIEAVVAFVFALMVGERSYRLAGLFLILVCVAKIVILDVWRQQLSDRYITFLILAAASLLISFLYSQYKETINRYL